MGLRDYLLHPCIACGKCFISKRCLCVCCYCVQEVNWCREEKSICWQTSCQKDLHIGKYMCKWIFEVILEWIDEITGLAGMRHSNGNITTASVDNLRFIRGAYRNDLIVLMARRKEPKIQRQKEGFWSMGISFVWRIGISSKRNANPGLSGLWEVVGGKIENEK